MWKASAGARVDIPRTGDGEDDWETDPDFINNVTEQEQRWGSKTIEGSGRTVGAIDMKKLREDTARGDEIVKQRQKADGPNASYGYGGKFGIEQDRMDRSAVGHDYIAKVEKHVSQTDYSTGFGGKFGVQTDRVDKSAVSWDHKENIEKHASQKDYSSGFGGKFGIEKDRQDKSAVGWDYVEKPQKHDSQTVGKPNNLNTEQVQKPSILKEKFENLARQNSEEAKPPRKIKQPKQILQNATENNTSPRITHSIQQQEPEPQQQPVHHVQPIQSVVFPPEKEQPVHHAQPIQSVVFPPEKEQPVHHVQPIQSVVFPPEKEQVVEKVIDHVEKQIKVENSEAERIEVQMPNETSFEPTALVPEPADLEEEPMYTAVALYDYQAGADDEISFDPDDIITHIEMIDEGWWRGQCHGRSGLFPANYVQLQQ